MGMEGLTQFAIEERKKLTCPIRNRGSRGFRYSSVGRVRDQSKAVVVTLPAKRVAMNQIIGSEPISRKI